MKEASILMDGGEDIVNTMSVLLQDAGKCPWCGEPIIVDVSTDFLTPRWICTNHECTESISYQNAGSWQYTWIQLIGYQCSLMLINIRKPEPEMSRQIPCPECTGDNLCETCGGELVVYLALVEKPQEQIEADSARRQAKEDWAANALETGIVF